MFYETLPVSSEPSARPWQTTVIINTKNDFVNGVTIMLSDAIKHEAVNTKYPFHRSKSHPATMDPRRYPTERTVNMVDISLNDAFT